MGLGSQLEQMQTWAQSLASEPERSLKAYAERFEAVAKQARKVLDQRKQAAAARADHRVREILPLVDDVNAVRMSVYGALLQGAVSRRASRPWAERFFRKSSRSAADVVTPPEGGAAPVSPPTPPTPPTT